MSVTVSNGHARPRELGADQLTCRRLHVEEAITGAGGGGGGGGAGVFTSLSVSGPTALSGDLVSNSDIITTGGMEAGSMIVGGILSAPTFTTSTINGAPVSMVTNSTGGAAVPIPAGSVFPTLTLPANPSGKYFVLDATSFSGQASNGTDPATARGAQATTAAARITAFANPQGLRDVWIYNGSPYTLAIGAAVFGSEALSAARGVWLPRTWLHRSTQSGGNVPVVEIEPLVFASPMVSVNPAVLTSPDATIGDFHLQYSVHATPGADAGVVLSGLLQVQFQLAAPANPVRIRVPLPVGPNAGVYPTQLAMQNNQEFIADWVAAPDFHFLARPVTVGVGTMMLNAALVPDDPTGIVRLVFEDGDPAAGYARLVVSGLTGGAGGYWVACPFRIPLDHIQYRATYPTF